MEENLLELNDYIVAMLRKIPQMLDDLEDVKVSQKSCYRDLVTMADKKLEDYIKKSILALCPNHEFLGEESYDKKKSYDTENLWIIDPIDGTTNFVKQGENYCCILSYFRENEPTLAYVYDIQNDILYSSMKGMGVYKNAEKLAKPQDKNLKESLVSADLRRLKKSKPDLFDYIIKNAFSIRVTGSSGLDGIKVIDDKLGAYIHSNAGAWDFSAFFLMASEMGLCFTDLEGNLPAKNKYSPFIIATPSLHKEIMDFLL